MARRIKRSSTGNIIRFTLKNSSTGVGLTGLSSTSPGLIISTICDNEAAATVYTVAASNIETIVTPGAYSAPTAGKCRFKEVDAINHKGLYEFQFADARFAVSNSKQLVISVTGATNLLDADYEIELADNVEKDVYDRIGAPAGASVSADIAAIKAKTDTIVWTDITDIKDESLGKWSINKTTNVLTFYKADGLTVLKQFNLTDNASVSERAPV